MEKIKTAEEVLQEVFNLYPKLGSTLQIRHVERIKKAMAEHTRAALEAYRDEVMEKVCTRSVYNGQGDQYSSYDEVDLDSIKSIDLEQFNK